MLYGENRDLNFCTISLITTDAFFHACEQKEHEQESRLVNEDTVMEFGSQVAIVIKMLSNGSMDQWMKVVEKCEIQSA